MAEAITWSDVARSLKRPYRVTVPMVILVSLVPLYLFIPALIPSDRPFHRPELPLDRALPVLPSWSLIYGVLYAFLIILPVFVLHQDEHIGRTVSAYLMVWITAYIIFYFYPTEAPRPEEVTGEGFAAWGLRTLYDSDPPYNCFPSLHVAHSFVSALTCYRLHRRLGIVAVILAALVGLSTLFTKQHYVVDVIAGAALAFAAYFIFLRNYPREAIPELERRVAPALAVSIIGILAIGLAGYWVVYRFAGD